MSITKNTNPAAAAATNRIAGNGTKETATCGVFFNAKTGSLTVTGNAAHEIAKRIKNLKEKHAKTEVKSEATALKREISDIYSVFVQIVQDLPSGQKQDALQILGLDLEGVSFLRGKLGYNLQYR